MCRSMSCKSHPLGPWPEYLKLTSVKIDRPVGHRRPPGRPGSVRVLLSESTSTMRLPDSPAMVIITKTMDTIIRLYEHHGSCR